MSGGVRSLRILEEKLPIYAKRLGDADAELSGCRLQGPYDTTAARTPHFFLES